MCDSCLERKQICTKCICQKQWTMISKDLHFFPHFLVNFASLRLLKSNNDAMQGLHQCSCSKISKNISYWIPISSNVFWTGKTFFLAVVQAKELPISSELSPIAANHELDCKKLQRYLWASLAQCKFKFFKLKHEVCGPIPIWGSKM